MKYNLFIMLVLMLFSGISGAQPVDYHIRVDNATNLRESYNVNSAVHEKVPAGTILRVLYEGTQGNWLQVERNGARVWIARWLAHSRVDAPGAQPAAPAASAPAAQVPANVDNCCYVDRQCMTDEQWSAGWHAYQSGECGQPPNASSQPAQAPQSSPAAVDNCCNVNRSCTTDAEWQAGWQAFQANNQCVAEAQGSGASGNVNSDGTYRLPAGCYESSRFEGRFFSSATITCESSDKITDPVPLSFFACDAYVSSRWSYRLFGTWTTLTTYSCR